MQFYLGDDVRVGQQVQDKVSHRKNDGVVVEADSFPPEGALQQFFLLGVLLNLGLATHLDARPDEEAHGTEARQHDRPEVEVGEGILEEYESAEQEVAEQKQREDESEHLHAVKSNAGYGGVSDCVVVRNVVVPQQQLHRS